MQFFSSFSFVTIRHIFLMVVAILSLFTGTNADSRDRPSVILVPGAFHRSSVYHKVVGLLNRNDYHHVYPIDLPSVGSLAGRNQDVDAVRKVLLKELKDQGRDVLLVGNSYGGTVIGEAVKGLKQLQARDGATTHPHTPRHAVRNGKILGLVYFAGFLPYINDVLHSEQKPDIRSISPSFFRFTNDGKVFSDGDPAFPPSVTFYNDLPKPESDFWTSKLTYSSFDSLAANATYIPYTGDFKCYYVIGKKDNSVPPALTQTYIQQPGAKFIVQEIDAGHIPMLGKPEEVTSIIQKAAGESNP